MDIAAWQIAESRIHCQHMPAAHDEFAAGRERTSATGQGGRRRLRLRNSLHAEPKCGCETTGKLEDPAAMKRAVTEHAGDP